MTMASVSPQVFLEIILTRLLTFLLMCSSVCPKPTLHVRTVNPLYYSYSEPLRWKKTKISGSMGIFKGNLKSVILYGQYLSESIQDLWRISMSPPFTSIASGARIRSQVAEDCGLCHCEVVCFDEL